MPIKRKPRSRKTTASRKAPQSQSALLAAFIKRIDAETAKKAAKISKRQPVHDRLFEAFMARFDALEAHRRDATIFAHAAFENPKILKILLKAQWNSMAEILRLAHVGKQTRANQLVQQTILLSVYDYALFHWLTDETPDMARTMAALDRALRYAHKTFNRLF